MKKARLMIQLPIPLKRKVDALRREGYTASGYIRALLERELGKNTHYPQRKVTYGKIR